MENRTLSGDAPAAPCPTEDITADLRHRLLATCTEDELRRWYDPLRLSVSEADRTVRVVFPHPFFGTWFAGPARSRFEEQLSLHLGPGWGVRYGEDTARDGSGAGSRGAGPSREPVRYIDFPFGRQFTFDGFLHNRRNYFPLASAREVARREDVPFNPFIVWGEPGSGKTHLVRSIANELAGRVVPDRIFLGSIDDIHTIYSVKFRNDVHAAREYLKDRDYLIVDDFQLIRKYPALEAELIVLFNFFHDHKRQMVFTCSDRISSYDFLDPKLRSRLEWGLVVTLKRPDLDVRTAYVQNQCKLRKIPLSKDRILTLAQRFENFRSLQGILLKMFAFKELVQQDIGAMEFEQIVSQTEDRPSESLKPDYILQIVGDHFGVGVKDLKGGKRHQKIVLARQTAMYLCRLLLGSSYPALGRLFGGKDHSTVLYSVKKVEELLKDNKETKSMLSELKKKCQQGPKA